MANKIKIKLKEGKSKIKLKHGDGPLFLDTNQLRVLLGAALTPALAAAPSPQSIEYLPEPTRKLTAAPDGSSTASLDD